MLNHFEAIVWGPKLHYQESEKQNYKNKFASKIMKIRAKMVASFGNFKNF